MQKEKKIKICMMGVFALLMAGCRHLKGNSDKEIATIGALAYAQSKMEDPVVYIMEEHGYQPYLVLESYGDGKTLLLRKHLLPQTRRVSDYSAYYEDSEMDQYLNGAFLEGLPEEIRSSILDSDIEILDQNCLNQLETKVTHIKRKVFLLSYLELGYSQNGHVGAEGTALEYFKDNEHRSAFTESDEASGWWLRSADSTYDSCVYAVGPEGEIGSTNAFEENGVRPAFCMDENVEICKKEGKYLLKNGNTDIFE